MNQGGSFGWYPSLVLTPVSASLTEFNAAKKPKPILQPLQIQAQKLHLLLQNKTAKKSGFTAPFGDYGM